MKPKTHRSANNRVHSFRERDVLHEVGTAAHALENLLMLSAVRRVGSADLRQAALVRLEETREMMEYMQCVTCSLLKLIHARRIGAAERDAVVKALMTIPMPRRSRISVNREAYTRMISDTRKRVSERDV
jgi:hypothetical protein